MIALDTSVVVRYLMLDDVEQSRAAGELIEGAATSGQEMFIGHVVLCELAWVLKRAYRLSKEELAVALTTMLKTAQFVVEDQDLAGRALERYRRGGADFADYLIAERAVRAGCERLYTFDRDLLDEPGFASP